MIVERKNVREDNVSCNFCRRGELTPNGMGLTYPYDYVYFMSPVGSGLTAVICEDCLSELSIKAHRFRQRKTHMVIDMTYHEDEGNSVFAGTGEECYKWVSEQGFGYEVVSMTNEELKIHNS